MIKSIILTQKQIGHDSHRFVLIMINGVISKRKVHPKLIIWFKFFQNIKLYFNKLIRNKKY